MKTSAIFVISPLVFTSCCQSNDPLPDQLLANTDMEAGSLQPNGWEWNSTSSGFSNTWTTEDSNSGTHSLAILRSTPGDSINFSYWTQTFQGTVPVGKDLTLSVKIKGKNLMGEGISIAIRGDDASAPLQFVTSEYAIGITGTFDWTTYNVKLTHIRSDVKTIPVYLILLPSTTGTVYFDDASLRVD